MSDDQVFKVDTVPPPDGEGDAYNAPTRVGAGPPVDVLDAMKKAATSGNPLKPQAIPAAASIPRAPPLPKLDGAVTDLAPRKMVDGALLPGAMEAPADASPADASPADASFARAAARLGIALVVVTVVFALIGR